MYQNTTAGPENDRPVWLNPALCLFADAPLGFDLCGLMRLAHTRQNTERSNMTLMTRFRQAMETNCVIVSTARRNHAMHHAPTSIDWQKLTATAWLKKPCQDTVIALGIASWQSDSELNVKIASQAPSFDTNVKNVKLLTVRQSQVYERFEKVEKIERGFELQPTMYKTIRTKLEWPTICLSLWQIQNCIFVTPCTRSHRSNFNENVTGKNCLIR